MTNIHECIDVGTVTASALFVRDATFFSQSLDSAPLVEVASKAVTSVASLSRAGMQTVAVDTSIGTFEAAYMPWRWRGSDYPTLIYHHGSGERPFDLGRFSSNSFRRLFVATDRPIPANLIAVRAPFHDGSNMDYARSMGDLENFVGMLAASVGLIDALVRQASEQTRRPVLASGLSLGGWAVNLHRACFDTADQYVPIFAGAALDDMFISSVYRKLTAQAARHRAELLTDVLNFEAEFTAVSPADCTPLLARWDRIIEYERQRLAYRNLPLSVIDKGHVTGSIATGLLRTHVLDALDL